MKQRILTACWLIPLAILWMFFVPETAFAAGAVVLVLLGAYEWGKFVFSGKNIALYAVIIAAFLGLSFWFCNPFSENLPLTVGTDRTVVGILGMGVSWWLIAVLLVFKYPGFKTDRILNAIFGVTVLLPFFWSLIYLHTAQKPQDLLPFVSGSANLFFVMLLVWCADSGAYFVGKACGKHHMIPAVSPNKTLEGLGGGILLSLIVAFAAYFFMKENFNPVHVAVAVVVVVVASVLGDLAESMFKRIAGIKDSSNLLPGHGGVLDRVDSLTAALPVYAFIMYMFH